MDIVRILPAMEEDMSYVNAWVEDSLHRTTGRQSRQVLAESRGQDKKHGQLLLQPTDDHESASHTSDSQVVTKFGSQAIETRFLWKLKDFVLRGKGSRLVTQDFRVAGYDQVFNLCLEWPDAQGQDAYAWLHSSGSVSEPDKKVNYLINSASSGHSVATTTRDHQFERVIVATEYDILAMRRMGLDDLEIELVMSKQFDGSKCHDFIDLSTLDTKSLLSPGDGSKKRKGYEMIEGDRASAERFKLSEARRLVGEQMRNTMSTSNKYRRIINEQQNEIERLYKVDNNYGRERQRRKDMEKTVELYKTQNERLDLDFELFKVNQNREVDSLKEQISNLKAQLDAMAKDNQIYESNHDAHAPFPVTVRTPAGKSFTIEVTLSQCIGQVKNEIAETKSLKLNDFRLIFAKTELDSSRTVADYKIKANSIINLFLVTRH